MRSEDNELAVERDTLAKKLRAQYFRLDPYIRGKGGELATLLARKTRLMHL